MLWVKPSKKYQEGASVCGIIKVKGVKRSRTHPWLFFTWHLPSPTSASLFSINFKMHPIIFRSVVQTTINFYPDYCNGLLHVSILLSQQSHSLHCSWKQLIKMEITSCHSSTTTVQCPPVTLRKKSKTPKHTLLILQGLAGFYLCWLHLQQLAPGSPGLVILASLMFFRKVKYTHLPACCAQLPPPPEWSLSSFLLIGPSAVQTSPPRVRPNHLSAIPHLIHSQPLSLQHFFFQSTYQSAELFLFIQLFLCPSL